MYEFIIDFMFKVPLIIPVITIILPLILGTLITPKYIAIMVAILAFINIIIFRFSSHPTIGMSGLGLYIFSSWIVWLSIYIFIKYIIKKTKNTYCN